jgi:murein DD-endopeptidase MepM/ murein hydrolase activator NlpD
MPPGAARLDLRRPGASWLDAGTPWTIGAYGEDRGIYTQALFAGARTVHLGLDLGGPEGVAVHSPLDGEVLHAGYNPAEGDYGYTVVTRHRLPADPGRAVHLLFGHLSAASLGRSPVGRRVGRGDVLGWLGGPSENGGWPPHVHVQLCWDDPGRPDLPGAAPRAEAEAWMARFPDPEAVLGPLR